jgi:hypothetical protein
VTQHGLREQKKIERYGLACWKRIAVVVVLIGSGGGGAHIQFVCGKSAGKFDARNSIWTMLSETNSIYFYSANAHFLFDQGADIFISQYRRRSSLLLTLLS